MEITLEKFFSRTKDADILITYRGPETGITSRQRLRESTRLLQIIDIKPMNQGAIYFTGNNLYQSEDTAGIVEELAVMFHPELFPVNKKQQYFFKLPDN